MRHSAYTNLPLSTGTGEEWKKSKIRRNTRIKRPLLLSPYPLIYHLYPPSVTYRVIVLRNLFINCPILLFLPCRLILSQRMLLHGRPRLFPLLLPLPNSLFLFRLLFPFPFPFPFPFSFSFSFPPSFSFLKSPFPYKNGQNQDHRVLPRPSSLALRQSLRRSRQLRVGRIHIRGPYSSRRRLSRCAERALRRIRSRVILRTALT